MGLAHIEIMRKRVLKLCQCQKCAHLFPHDVNILCGTESLVSQTRPTSAKGSGELCIQAVYHCTVQCGPIMLQYLVT